MTQPMGQHPDRRIDTLELNHRLDQLYAALAAVGRAAEGGGYQLVTSVDSARLALLDALAGRTLPFAVISAGVAPLRIIEIYDNPIQAGDHAAALGDEWRVQPWPLRRLYLGGQPTW